MLVIHKKHTGFTLVELVVVATILAILGAVGFSSYTGYISGARDSNRIAQLENIRSGLQTYATKSNLPLPSDYITVVDGATTLGYQGYAGETILNVIGLEKGGKDPLDDIYYSYYLHSNKNSFQLLAYLEDESSLISSKNSPPISHTTFASDYSLRFPTVTGESLGILIGTGLDSNTPIHEIETVKTATSIDIGSTTEVYTAIIKDYYVVSGDNSDLSVLSSLSKTKGKVGVNCKDLLDSNPGLLGEDGEYIISQDGEAFISTDCNMTYDGGGWTRYTQYDISGYYVYELGDLITDFNNLFYAYKRGGTDSYAFKFSRFYVKHCEDVHGDVDDLKLGMRDYVDHIENASWGTCGRTNTTGDANDIAVEKIIEGNFIDDPCLTGNLNKTTSRNSSWGLSTTTDGKSVGTIQHRISNHTVLFGPQGDGSRRCAGSSGGPAADEVYMYLR